MGAKYIFRLDDICENMNWDNYQRVKSIFLKNDIKPIIGVIPNNKDNEFLKYPKCNFEFWDEIRNLQNKEKWSIALHGYTHVYENENSGIFKKCTNSEFAGLSMQEQNHKISEGKRIFEYEKLRIDAFMAPSHSMDNITIECLKRNEINVVTDGWALYPYYYKDVLFVPQLFATPKKMPFGIYTWCFHTNTMSEKNIDELEIFITENKKDIICFSEAEKYNIGNINYRVQSFILKNSITFARKLRR